MSYIPCSVHALLEGRGYRMIFAPCLVWSTVTGSSVLLTNIYVDILTCLTLPGHISSASWPIGQTVWSVCSREKQLLTEYLGIRETPYWGDSDGQPACICNWSPNVYITVCSNWWRGSRCFYPFHFHTAHLFTFKAVPVWWPFGMLSSNAEVMLLWGNLPPSVRAVMMPAKLSKQGAFSCVYKQWLACFVERKYCSLFKQWASWSLEEQLTSCFQYGERAY